MEVLMSVHANLWYDKSIWQFWSTGVNLSLNPGSQESGNKASLGKIRIGLVNLLLLLDIRVHDVGL